MRTQLRRLREAGVDGSMIRIDTLCGRLALPTTYRLSRFVTDPRRESKRDPPATWMNSPPGNINFAQLSWLGNRACPGRAAS